MLKIVEDYNNLKIKYNNLRLENNRLNNRIKKLERESIKYTDLQKLIKDKDKLDKKLKLIKDILEK